MATTLATRSNTGAGDPALLESPPAQHRTSWAAKLLALDPEAPPERTEARLEAFTKLFVQRYAEGITTRVGQGPRSWTRLPCRIRADQVARHLLGGRIPELPVIWIGTRSFDTTRWVCLDIDADRNPAEKERPAWRPHVLARNTKTQACRTRTSAPFAERCRQVEQALRRLGIDPRSPSQVLTLQSPSGGRHTYIFLDTPTPLQEIKQLLQQAGLRFAKGQIELYPSPSQGLRLPFGEGQHNDPLAWRRFIDDYQRGRTRRHALHRFREHLAQYHRQQLTASPRPQSARPAPASRPRPRPRHPGGQLRRAGIPKSQKLTYAWYRQVVENGPETPAEFDRLWETGILLPGTRHRVLNCLAAHLTWFRYQPAEEAAANLTAWTQDPRHQSKDIQADLAHGTSKVGANITKLCQWYADHKRTVPPGQGSVPAGHHSKRFAPAELAVLRPLIRWLPKEERVPQAHFLLHFLWFAKRHGQPAPDGQSWSAAVAINAVVKKWEGCRHANDYKKRFDRATAAGLLAITKEKWQNPNGPGRARTYRLAVPVAADHEQVIDYEAARKFLCEGGSVGVPGKQAAQQRSTSPTQRNGENESHERNRNAADPHPCPDAGRGQGGSSDHANRDPANRDPANRDPANRDPAIHEGSLAAAVRQDPRERLDQGARERPPQPHAHPGLPDQDPGGIGAVPHAAVDPPHQSSPWQQRREAWRQRRAQEFLSRGQTGKHGALPVQAQIATFAAAVRRRSEETSRSSDQPRPHVPKTLDGHPLPPSDDPAGISQLIAIIKQAVAAKYPNRGVEHHPAWTLLEQIAQAPWYTTEQRQLLLSDPTLISDEQLQTRKALIRDYRKRHGMHIGSKSS